MVAELSIFEQAKALYGVEAIAYTAGFFDGEGCVSIYTRPREGRNIGVQVFFVNTDIEPLEFCQKVIGGNISVHYKGNVLKGHNISYKLAISNRQSSKRALEIMLPHLIVKQELACLIIDLIESLETHIHGYTPNELEIITRVKEINRRGI